IDHQLRNVLATRGVNRYTFAARDVTDNVFAVQRVAATGPRHHQIVNATNDDRIITQTNETFDCAYAASKPGLFLLVELLELFRTKVLRNHVARHEFALADPCEQIVDTAITI